MQFSVVFEVFGQLDFIDIYRFPISQSTGVYFLAAHPGHPDSKDRCLSCNGVRRRPQAEHVCELLFARVHEALVAHLFL